MKSRFAMHTPPGFKDDEKQTPHDPVEYVFLANDTETLATQATFNEHGRPATDGDRTKYKAAYEEFKKGAHHKAATPVAKAEAPATAEAKEAPAKTERHPFHSTIK